MNSTNNTLVNAIAVASGAQAQEPNQLDAATLAAYMYAGNAVFTIKNARTGARMTFKVKRSKKNENRFFVSANLLGDGDQGYVELGSIYYKRTFYIGANCPETENDVAIRAIKFLIANAAQITNFPHIEVYHCGYCGRCGRRLTTPESCVQGIGPECARREAAAGIVPAGQRRTVGQRPNARA